HQVNSTSHNEPFDSSHLWLAMCRPNLWDRLSSARREIRSEPHGLQSQRVAQPLYTMGSCLRRHPVGGPDVLLHVDGSNTGARKIIVACSQRRLLRGGKAEAARGVAANVTLVPLGSRRDLGEWNALTHHCLLLRWPHGE